MSNRAMLIPIRTVGDYARDALRRRTRRQEKLRSRLSRACQSFLHWCVLVEGIDDGRNITRAEGDRLLLELRRQRAPKWLLECQALAIDEVLNAVTVCRRLGYHHPRELILWVPQAGEIWEKGNARKLIRRPAECHAARLGPIRAGQCQ
jgi:hypothetical protein